MPQTTIIDFNCAPCLYIYSKYLSQIYAIKYSGKIKIIINFIKEVVESLVNHKWKLWHFLFKYTKRKPYKNVTKYFKNDRKNFKNFPFLLTIIYHSGSSVLRFFCSLHSIVSQVSRFGMRFCRACSRTRIYKFPPVFDAPPPRTLSPFFYSCPVIGIILKRIVGDCITEVLFSSDTQLYRYRCLGEIPSRHSHRCLPTAAAPYTLFRVFLYLLKTCRSLSEA